MKYIDLTLLQRINYKGNQVAKAVAMGRGKIDCKRILQERYEETGHKAPNGPVSYSLNSRKHFK